MKGMKKLKEGDRVLVLSLGLKGTVTFIDWKTLKFEHMYPYQLDMDKRYHPDGSTQTMYRTSRMDLRKLRKKVKE